MKLKVLVDNNTLCDSYGEWGLSFYIEDDNKKILFDTGYSNLFIENAEQMEINLKELDYVAISHGHSDHTWGLQHLIKLYREKGIIKNERPKIIAHNKAFLSRISPIGADFGTIVSEQELSNNFELELSKEVVWITDSLVFLGEIERKYNFENKEPIGKILESHGEKDDYLMDDTALVYKSTEGLVIIVGCSHSGICNIVEHAKKICKDDRVVDIIGGLHLLNPSKEQIDGTIEYMKNLNPKSLHPCHCTDLKSKIALSKVATVEELGVGSELEYR
ncbi:MBL fold metallo-hydrolase [Oceanirhabdus seepicola]|uniref:MBL fold metallo-hydrolase n=1 Tax=Oceanirhabdus seepicola TaxID=2828781 RepID=A0A9J6NVZ7_9CLOT|nr:MBL fold metallo-hydrolase [Oceanirhabdus seepicola]MCM1988228.1 MBL fold metallo-hydrolase [Oceanirhabdus seepicola]